MKYLITGLNGFVGSYLAEQLIKENAKISGTIYPKNSIQNITHIINKIETLPCDLSSGNKIDAVIKKIKPDNIIHLAAQGYVPLSWSNPIETCKINILGTLYLLEAVKKHCHNTKILFVGSGDEYGISAYKNSITEKTPLTPHNPYSVSKTCADLLAEQIGKYNHLHIVRVRAFLHAGPKQSPDFVISNFSKQIALIEKGKQSPEIKVGDLKYTRDFTDVRDIASAYLLAIKKGENGAVYNISSGKVHNIREILNKLLNLTDKKIRISVDPERLRVQDHYIKNISSAKFRKVTGWRPEIPLNRTLEDTLNWWREQIK